MAVFDGFECDGVDNTAGNIITLSPPHLPLKDGASPLPTGRGEPPFENICRNFFRTCSLTQVRVFYSSITSLPSYVTDKPPRIDPPKGHGRATHSRSSRCNG